MDSHDHLWIDEYLLKNSNIENISIVACSFEGRLVAESLKLSYKSYEKEAWGIDKLRLFDLAREKSYRWCDLPEIKNDYYVNKIRSVKEYPLLIMHQSQFLLSLWEILQSYEFMKKVIEIERPDKITMGRRENPFLENRLFILTGSNGLERETAKAIAKNNNIDYIEMPISISKNRAAIFRKIIMGLNNPKMVFQKIIAVLGRYSRYLSPSSLSRPQLIWKAELTGPKILIFADGGYYLKQVSETFDILLQEKARIALIIAGGELTIEEKKVLMEKGICIFYKDEWKIENEKDILDEWKSRGLMAFKSISECERLKKYFSDENCSYFPELVEESIKKELVENVPLTVLGLLRSEAIISSCAPDLVVANFALHPDESCNVLPARVAGIPTLNLDHGVGVFNDGVVRDTFSTQYFASTGSEDTDARMKSLKCLKDAIAPVGVARLEKINNLTGIQMAKKRFGFNPANPLCIFCDMSEFSQTFEKRHSTYQTVKQMVALKNNIPNLQLVYRVHHGMDYQAMQKYFDDFHESDVIFQISPNPSFLEVVQAADVVVSHYSSAITEALVCGVRVIYLCELSYTAPPFFDYEVIKVADEFEKLPILVKDILDNPIQRETVIKMAQPYFEKVLCGNDGKSIERLSRLIMRLAQLPKDEWKKGFQDWIDRIEASCVFQSGTWKADRIFKKNA